MTDPGSPARLHAYRPPPYTIQHTSSSFAELVRTQVSLRKSPRPLTSSAHESRTTDKALKDNTRDSMSDFLKDSFERIAEQGSAGHLVQGCPLRTPQTSRMSTLYWRRSTDDPSEETSSSHVSTSICIWRFVRGHRHSDSTQRSLSCLH